MSEPANNRTGEKKRSQVPPKPRYAVALYDFLGSREQKTLTVFKGDVLRIKEVTDGQWWLGECNGVLGFVPRTYVSLMDPNWTPEVERQLSASGGGSVIEVEDEEKEGKDDDLTDDDDDDETGKAYTVAVVALYNFEKKDPRHMAFKKHDKFFVVEPLTPEQPWFEARFNGEEGLVPANRVYILKPGETDAPKKKKDDGTPQKNAEAKEETPVKKVAYVKAIALRDYSVKSSELSFTRGDVLEVEISTASDWWPARFNGKQGVIPKQFVRVMDSSSSSDIKKELLFNYITGNQHPSRSSCLNRKDIRDIPFFAALFALKAGLPQDSDVENRTVDRTLSTMTAGGRELVAKDEEDDAPIAGKPSKRLTNIVNAVRANREAVSREMSEDGASTDSNVKDKSLPKKKVTMTATVTAAPPKRTELNRTVTDAEVLSFEKYLRFHFLSEGSILFNEGADDDNHRSAYIVLEGEVDVRVARESYGSLGVGQFFGLESLMIENSKRAFTATGKAKQTILAVIPHSGHRALSKLIGWYEDAMRNLYKSRTGASLQRLSLFHKLDSQSLDYLGMRMNFRKLKKGQGVTEPDDDSTGPAAPPAPSPTNGNGTAGGSPSQQPAHTPAVEDGLFVVFTGTLSVTVKVADGTKRELRRIGPGQFFGENAFLGYDNQVCTATALSVVIVMFLSKTDLQLYSHIDTKARAEVSRIARFRTADVLRSIPLVESVPPQKQEVLAAAFEYVLKRDGDEYYERGQNICMYLVCEGEIELLDDQGDLIRTLRLGMWFGEKALSGTFESRPIAKSEAGDLLDGNGETPIAHGSNRTLCVAISRESFERFLEVVPEIKTQLKQALQLMTAQQDPASALQLKNLIPTSADELACVTQLPSDFLTKDPEVKQALDSWAEIGKVMAPCLKALQGYPQYLHPVPFDFGGRDPLRKFNVTIVKVDSTRDTLVIHTSASETVGELVNNIFKQFAQMTGGRSIDAAGSTMFGLKVASRADYLLEREVELGRYKCVTAALRRELVHGELKFALVDLRSNPRLGPGLRMTGQRQHTDTVSTVEGTLMEAVAIYDHDGLAGGLAFRAGDRLEVEPRMGEAWWPAVLVSTGATGMVPQNVVKAIAPIIGPTRGLPTMRRVFGPQVSGAVKAGVSPQNVSGEQSLQALPPMGLDEWARAVNEGFAKCEKLPASWGNLAPPVTHEVRRKKMPIVAPWPLRLRLRGFERLFAVPGIERCGFLQVRIELVFGGQVLEKKLSKPVKRNSVLRFEDEWFYFSKFATDLNVSTRITLTLLGLDVSGGAPLVRSPSFDDNDEPREGGRETAPTATEMVRRMDSSNTLMGPTKETGLGMRITNMFSRKKPSIATRLRGATGSVSSQEPPVLKLTASADTLATAEQGEGASVNTNAKDKDVELAGASFSLWESDLTLRGGVLSYGLWPGQGGDRMLYCVENYEHDCARVVIELDRYAEPVRYQMPPAVVPSSDGPAPVQKPIKQSNTAVAPAQARKPNPKLSQTGKGGTGGSDRNLRKDRRKSVSVFVPRQHDPTHAMISEKPQVSKKVQELLGRDPLQVYQMTEVEKALIWAERELLVEDPLALSKVMLSVNWTNPGQRDQALQLLSRWAVPAPMQALELLDARFGEYRLREFAVKCLEEFDDEELADFLLQLVQVLKFEAFHDSPLARFLFRRALANPREIGNKLFWSLRAEMHVKKFAPRFGLILKAYLRACGPHFAELAQQHDAQELLKTVARSAQRMKNVSKAERTALARAAIVQVNERMPRTFELPLDPRMRACRFNPDQCRIMSSKKRPLWMALESVDPPECGGENMLVMFKAGDDLRQDQMTLQIIRVLEQIWLAEGMNMRLTPYGCISTGDELGMLEIVPNSDTIAHIETTQGGTFGSLKDTPIRKFLEVHNKGSVDQAIDNFVRSCAGYCVATYIIGLGDRHNDNILCCRDGRLFHIDFGHFLGNFKTVAALGGFKRERTPFVLTKGMAYAMGGKGTEEFTRFVDLCCRAFNIIRAHGDELVTLFRLMVPAGMPELKSDDDIQYLVDQLHLGKSDDEANQIFQAEINSAIGDFYRRVDNFLHTIKHS